MRELGRFYASIRAAEQRPAGLDDGSDLSLGVKGPLQVGGASSPAICQCWLGTDPRPGLGATQSRVTLWILIGVRWVGGWGGSRAAESNSTTFRSDQMLFIATLLLSEKNRNIIKPIKIGAI